MNRSDIDNYVKRIASRGSVLGLEGMIALMDHLGNPQNNMRTIHIAGTNGKGSVGTYISSILSCEGKIGRYISPVVFEKNEMVQWEENGATHYFTQDEYYNVMEKVVNGALALESTNIFVTPFEIETAFAFCLLASWKCDYSIIEVGMGGRLDATNVIKKPECVVITPIGMDHIGVLGNDILSITAEKCGIMKKKVPVFSCQKSPEVLNEVAKWAQKNDTTVKFVDSEKISIEESNLEGTRFSYKTTDYFTKMIGSYQMDNACLAIEVCNYLNATFLKKGLEVAQWPGRFQVLQKNPVVIIDGAHNEAAAIQLAKSIDMYLGDYSKIIGVMGVFKDKEYEKIVDCVAEKFDTIIATAARGERSLSPDVLEKTCLDRGVKVFKVEKALNAYQKALQIVPSDGAVVVFGTLSILKDITH